MSQQHASVSQGRICEDNFTCYHTEIEVADPTFHLTQSQYTDTGRPVPALTLQRQGPGRVAIGVQFLSYWYDSSPEKSRRERDTSPGSSALEADALTTRPSRRSAAFEEIASPDNTVVFLLLHSPARSLGITILGEIVAYVTV